MIEGLITLLVYVLVLGIVAWLVLYIIGLIPMEEPFKQGARIIVIVICCLVVILLLLQLIGVAPPLHLR